MVAKFDDVAYECPYCGQPFISMKPTSSPEMEETYGCSTSISWKKLGDYLFLTNDLRSVMCDVHREINGPADDII